LGGYLSGAVSKRGVAVDHASYRLRERYRFALRFARDVAEAVHERHVRVVEICGSRFDGVVQRCGPAVDERVGKRMFRRVMLEPRVAKTTGVLRLDDALAISVQLDVVADASAARARRIRNDR